MQNELYDMATENLGNIFATGKSYFSSGMQNSVTLAYDGWGNLLWTIPYNPTEVNGSSKIIVSSSGIYVFGFKNVSGDFSDLLTCKYNYVASVKENIEKENIN